MPQARIDDAKRAALPLYVLAFDIERAGPTPEYDTIAIGAVVLDRQRNIVKLPKAEVTVNSGTVADVRIVDFGVQMKRWEGYVPGETKFEKKCWEEFWVNEQDVLKQIAVKDKTASRAKAQRDMITGFLRFTLPWYTWYMDGLIDLRVTSDNVLYDAGFINNLIYEYRDYVGDLLPMPFTLKRGKQIYDTVYNTHDMQRGLLWSLHPKYIWKTHGYDDAMKEEFYMPEPPEDIAHDHLPDHDAYGIACSFVDLIDIADGKIRRRIN